MTSTNIFHTNFVTSEDEILITNATYLSLPTNDGIEGFLANHQNDSYYIKPGICTVHTGAKDDYVKYFQIGTGHAKYQNNVLDVSIQYIFSSHQERVDFLTKLKKQDKTTQLTALIKEIEHFGKIFATLVPKDD